MSKTIRTTQATQAEWISAENSTTTLLGGGGVFTGTAVDILDFDGVRVTVYSDKASAAGGLSIQFSPDGTNWDFVDTYSVTAATALSVTLQKKAQYARVLYTNGGAAQATFRLQTCYGNYQGVGAFAFSDVAGADKKALVDAARHVQADVLTDNVTQLGGTAIKTNGGAKDAGTQTVTLATDDPAVTALQIIDDWDETDRAKVNPIAGQAGIAAGAGVVGVTVPRVTLASDDPGIVALQIMDDWDETDRAKVNPIAGQAGIAAGAGVVGVTVPRTTLASDDPAVVALQVIDDWDETDRAKVNPIVGQAGIAAGAGAVGVTVPRVTLASDDPGVAALNKLNALASAVEVVPTQIIKTVAAIATPEALAADGTFCRSMLIIAKKAARTANAGNIYLGIGATNDTQPYEMAPGDVLRIGANPGTKMDLNDWYVDVLNAGDGVAVIYS